MSLHYLAPDEGTGPRKAKSSRRMRGEWLTPAAASRSVPSVTRALRIAIDLRPLALDSVTGVGLVITQILEELEGRGAAFIGVSDRAIPSGRISPSIPVLAEKGSGGRIRWEWSILRRLLQRIEPRPDLYHATWNHGVPGRLPFPSVLTIHDMIPWRLPEVVTWPWPALLHRRLYRRAVRGASRAAAAVVAVSEASRLDIAEFLPESAARIEVVPNAVPRWFHPNAVRDKLVSRERFAGGRPYWLYLGGFDPRKGIPTLLMAMADAFPNRAEAPDLVLAGAVNRYARDCKTLARGLGLRATFPGYVPDIELPALFSGANLFVYPSRYEGFGIPILLAMAAGVACVAGNGGSLPEILGDAGLLFPSEDVEALAAILRRAAVEPGFLAPFASRGPSRASQFSVEALGERMLRVYERAAASRA